MSTKNESIECRYCNSKLSKVVETRIIPTQWRGVHTTFIRRARQCLHCHYRYFTIETYESLDEPLTPEVPGLDFINLEVKEQTQPQNPLDPVPPPRIAPPPARGDDATRAAYATLYASPKETPPPAGQENAGGLPRGPRDQTSLGKSQKRA